MQNDGENFSLNSISTDFATPSVQPATDCFRMGRTINQFRRFCRLQSPVSLSPSENSTGVYSSISVLETDWSEEPATSSHAELSVHEENDDDEDEDGYICEINAKDHYRLCKSRAAHDSVDIKPDTFLAKKILSTTAAPHLKFQDSISKLHAFAKVVDLDVPTILQEQLKYPVLSIVRAWIEGSISPDRRAPEI